MCTHADAQTSTASESFRCDVCRQRRAFFNEKATTRVYVTRQKLLDFSCFAFGKYRGGKSRIPVDGFRGERDREIFRFVNGLAEAVRLIDINAVYVCERWVLSAYTINCLPPNESTERCSTLAIPKPNIAASLSRSPSAQVFAIGAQRRFYKFIYRNDARAPARVRAALRSRKYLPSISNEG